MRGIKGDISFELFQDFSNNYVGNIISIAKLLSKSKQKHLLVIPSTIAVTETPIGMVEYAAAKAALEIISKGIEKTYTNLRIICPRLERVKTFQTLSIINKGKTSAEASLELGKIILENIDSFLD